MAAKERMALQMANQMAAMQLRDKHFQQRQNDAELRHEI
jgi:hypothetical protein